MFLKHGLEIVDLLRSCDTGLHNHQKVQENQADQKVGHVGQGQIPLLGPK
jgi:hypothetical protein